MTSLISYLLGRQPCFSTTSNLADEGQQLPHQNRTRNRLKKEPPPEIFYSCEDLQDTIRFQSHPTWCPNLSNVSLVYSGYPDPQPHPIDLPSISVNQSSMKLQQSWTSTSLYPQYELKADEFRRTRAKTPVHRIGQLENKPCDTDRLNRDIDAAILLAQQYQAVLPSREATPCPRLAAANARYNGLRRVKCSDSLRDLVKIPNSPEMLRSRLSDDKLAESVNETSFGNFDSYYTAESYPDSQRPIAGQNQRGSFDSRVSRRDSSDSETLLGSDSELSPNTPVLDYFSNSDLDAIKMIPDSGAPNELPDLMMAENDIGMQLAMDLLTNDLATALHRQHAMENGNEVSGLQILLMIEAYESLQQKLRQEQRHVTEVGGEHVRDVLDHWLQALRSLYERSISRNGQQSQASISF